MSKKLVLIILAAMAASAVIIFFVLSTPFAEKAPLVNTPAPEIHLADLTGTMQSLSNYRGRVIIINFWATWCPPCKDQLRLFQKLYGDFKEQGLMIFAISLDDVSPDEVTQLMIGYPVFIANERVKRDYGDIKNVPRTFLIGKNGRIMKKTKEYYNEGALKRDIEAALRQVIDEAAK